MNKITLSIEDKKELQLAKNLLENPGVAIKITNLIGKPIEKGLDRLPKDWNQKLGDLTTAALKKSVDTALYTMKDIPTEKSSNIWHKVGVMASGGIGGFFGLSALVIELPISTTIMLRSIADIARSEGESIDSDETKAACLEVFALGGKNDLDDGAETSYYAIRAMINESVNQSIAFLTKSGVSGEGAPFILRVITTVAERFSIQVTEKAAAQLVPALGAIGGATINTLFIDHFQDMARGHFKIRKLERKFGKEIIKSAYLSLPVNG